MTSPGENLHEDEIIALVHQLCNGQLETNACGRLEQYLSESDAALQCYLEYMDGESQLLCRSSSLQLTPKLADDNALNAADLLPTYGEALPTVVVDDTFHGSQGWAGGLFGAIPQGMLFAYLVAAVLLGIGLKIASVVSVSPSVEIAATNNRSNSSPVSAAPQYVARITGMVDCVWKDRGPEKLKSEIPNQKSPVSLGDRFNISSGLLELTYDTGAKVILQGPVTYDVD